MGWSVGFDPKWNRDIGYGVPAHCDHPGCTAEIDRGLSYVCGGEPYGGDKGCGLYFCDNHLWFSWRSADGTQLCERCIHDREPFTPTPDIPRWITWKLTDSSWAQWRTDNPDKVQQLRTAQPEPSLDP
ncbi:hypothetical protein [Nocardia transvalensis]|uniref:hypothetical protein n=1 Tax=Nocardia transvalensis TaxID=37333 RepID=UPI0018937944|nr:hypothetical protein [Nocardia transvalensis]MBF6333672.1 hypothetical protein [Nocardia transvalensis]